MKKTFQIFAIAICFLTAQFVAAQKITYVYEDNTKNNEKVEWTRTMEAHDAEIGKPKVFLMPVKNISKEPLTILSAKTHCGCTDAIAPKAPIPPGETGFIEVTFTAKPRYQQDKNGVDMSVPPPFTFYQIIDVFTNFDPKNSITVSVQGTVVK